MKKITFKYFDAKNSGAYSGYDWESDMLSSEIESVCPINSDVIASVSPCTLKDYEELIIRTKKAFLVWRQIPAPKRGEIVRQMGNALRKEQENLATLITYEVGKSKVEAKGEVQEMIDMADFAVGQSRMLYGKTMHSERSNHRFYEQWHPLGIVGVITAFNFPGAVWAWNAFLSAICGNVVLWKPSSFTRMSAIAVHKICATVLKENQMPAIFSLMLPQTHTIAERLIDDTAVPLISFTGSSKTGKHIASRVSARLGRSILELGGNNAVILAKSANLQQAIPQIVFGAVGTSGQRCTTTRRLFVHEAIFDEVLKHLKKSYQKLPIGNPLDEQNLIGPLINLNAVNRYVKVIDEIKAAGGVIEHGGRAIGTKGYFVEPTLVTGLENTHKLVQQETFAPILYVMPFKTLDEAIDMQNNVRQGLSSALFSENFKEIEAFLSATGSDCGIANINIGTSGAEIGGAFGGEKETGGGREAGSDAWKAYMRRQTNTLNWGDEIILAQGIRFDAD